MKIEALKKEYEILCNRYIEIFCKKHGIEFDFWIGDTIADVGCFNGDYFFNFSEIVLDIHSRQPKGFILEWHNYNDNDKNYISYDAYIKGIRHENIKHNLSI